MLSCLLKLIVQIIKKTIYPCSVFQSIYAIQPEAFLTDPVHDYHGLNHQYVPWPSNDKSICNLNMPSANVLTAISFKSCYANQILRNEKLLNLKQ
jgi:hypothetical protein